jgi:hypothetical protein
MSEDPPVASVDMKRTTTAELRLRFDSSAAYLSAGFNHKEICKRLNSEGLEIPYPQFRATMSRLRKERQSDSSSQVKSPVQPESFKPALPLRPPPEENIKPDHIQPSLAPERSLTWDPSAPVKWN